MVSSADFKITSMECLFLICLIDNRIREYEELKMDSPIYFHNSGLPRVLDSCYSLKDKLFDIYLSYSDQKELIEND